MRTYPCSSRANIQKTRPVLSGALVTCAVTFAAEPLAQVPVTRLSVPDRVSRVAFDNVSSVRTLPDGSLLVADAGARSLMRVRWDGETAAGVGRLGDGPREYRAVGHLVPLRGDSTLLTDSYSGRWLLLHDGTIVATVPETSPLIQTVTGGVIGVDSRGRIGGRSPLIVDSRDGSASDSAAILLVDRARVRVDTVATIRVRSTAGFTRLPPTGGRPAMILAANPLATEEQAVLFEDGVLAIARLDPYRVDWRMADGRWLRGKALPIIRHPVDATERCRAVRRVLGAESDCGETQLSDWPPSLPPFLPRVRPVITPVTVPLRDGRLLIRRVQPHHARMDRYDIVDRAGALAGIIELPVGEVILEHVPTGLVALRTDEDGLQKVVLYTTALP